MKTFYNIALISALVFTSKSSFAVFQDIWKGYQASKVNISRQMDSNINEQNFKFELNKFDWQLFVTPSYDSTFLDALFSFQSRHTITSGVTYGVTKNSYQYGTFSLQQEVQTYDLSNWENDSFLQSLPGTSLYETRNTLSYSYDFLDKSNDLDFELTHINHKLGDLEAKQGVEQGYFDFFNVYIQAKLQVYIVKLTSEFVKESKKRLEQIQKRFKDGLSREVELLQAKSNLLNQKEALEKARSSLKQNLAIIENLVGFKIKDEYFSDLSWKFNGFSFWKSFIKEDKNLNLEILKKRLELTEKNLEKINEQNGHKLTLRANYITNAIDSDTSDSLSNSFKGDRFSQNVSITWTMPLGVEKNKALVKRNFLQKKKNELDLLSLKDEVEVKKSALLEQIQYLETAGKIASSKIDLNKQTLKEQNKLYLRGQSSFEEVIRAEEAYINVRLSEKRLLAEYELLIANYAYLNSSTKSLLDNYQD